MHPCLFEKVNRMTIAQLFNELSAAGLSIRRADGDHIEVVGDAAKLTEPVKMALAEHKRTLLASLPNPEARPTPAPVPTERQWWWNDKLSHIDNQTLDDFMAYDPELGPAGEVEEIVLTDGCERCGSRLGWVDLQGNEHCLGHEKPNLRSYAHQSATLREKAAERLVDDSVPMYAPTRPYRGRKQRAKYAGASK